MLQSLMPVVNNLHRQFFQCTACCFWNGQFYNQRTWRSPFAEMVPFSSYTQTTIIVILLRRTMCSCNHCWLFFSYELIILIHWRLADIRFLLPYTIRKGQCSINWAHRLLFLHSRTGMTCTNFQSIGLVFVEEIFFVLFKFIENIKLWDAVESELFRNLNVVPLWYGNL